MQNLDLIIILPYVIAFLFIFMMFKFFNKGKNPFKMMLFWITQITAVIIITAGIGFIIFAALGGGDSDGDTLAKDIDPETITSITIIQRRDTVRLDSIYPFLFKLEYVEHVSGPVKYPNYGKMIFIRNDGSKDSLNTNGSGFGPYKGRWYMSKDNVLEGLFKK